MFGLSIQKQQVTLDLGAVLFLCGCSKVACGFRPSSFHNIILKTLPQELFFFHKKKCSAFLRIKPKISQFCFGWKTCWVTNKLPAKWQVQTKGRRCMAVRRIHSIGIISSLQSSSMRFSCWFVCRNHTPLTRWATSSYFLFKTTCEMSPFFVDNTTL